MSDMTLKQAQYILGLFDGPTSHLKREHPGVMAQDYHKAKGFLEGHASRDAEVENLKRIERNAVQQVWEESHDRKVWRDAYEKTENALAAGREASRKLAESFRALTYYVRHQNPCILLRWEGGEPTAGGGYRSKYAGEWHQSKPVDETPKCNCGLDELLKKAADQ